MRLQRLVPLLLAGIFLPVVIPGGVLGVGAQTEVDRAAGEVERVAAEREEARNLVDSWAARRGTAQDRIIATLFSLGQTNQHLEQVAFEVFDLRQEILEAEARVSHLREITEARAVAAYMSGAAGGVFSIWTASNFEQTALLEETAVSAQRVDEIELTNLANERQHLVDLQNGYKARQASLGALREDIAQEGEALVELFATIDAEYLASYAGLQRADAAYQHAVSEAEAAVRRRAARAGVETWRPLVQQYFPEVLVEQALRVMACESRGNPDAVHPGSDATGLFQFLAGTWAFSSVRAGFPGASRFDAEANVAGAAWLVDYSIRTGHPGGAWGHWVCQP
jgi:hypothetical protein